MPTKPSPYGWDSARARLRSATGSCCWSAPLSVPRRCLVPRLATFPLPPVSSRTAGFPRSGWGLWLSPMKPSHEWPMLKRWPACTRASSRVCFSVRRAWVPRSIPGTVSRLLTVAQPPQPRAPWLQRHYPPSSLLRAHAQVLWPLPFFGHRPGDENLCRLSHPRLVHWTVPALTSALSESVAPPTPRVCSVHLAVSSRAAAAFAERVAARQPLGVRNTAFLRGEFSTLQAFLNVTTLSFASPSGRSHGRPRGRDFVIRACTEFVSSSCAGSATRLKRPTVAADLSSTRTDVLLAAHSFIHNTSPV